MYDKAMSLFEEAWEGRKHKLGDKHLDALTAGTKEACRSEEKYV